MVQTIWQESYSDCTQEKKKLRIVQYLNYSNCVSFSSWDQGLIGNKARYIAKVCKFYIEKGYLMLTGLKVSSLTCKCVFYGPELNAKAGPHGIEFCKPWHETYQWIELKKREKWGRLSSYHVYFHS